MADGDSEENGTIHSSKDSKRFLVLYGTQTGQAKAIAEEIVEKSIQLDLKPSLHCFGKVEKEFVVENEPLIVIVTSTTGDGEPPDTVQKFWRRIKRRTIHKGHLCNLQYALLGLGDSNYNNFCNCAKMMNQRLQEIGARQLMEPGFADDATGLETVVEPWIDNLLKTLITYFKSPYSRQSDQLVNTELRLEPPLDSAVVVDSLANSVAKLKMDGEASTMLSINPKAKEAEITRVNGSHDEDVAAWFQSVPAVDESQLILPSSPAAYISVVSITREPPRTESPIQNNCALPFANSKVYAGTIVEIKTLTSADAVKTTLHVTLTSQEKLEYEPGDSFGVLTGNDPREVDWLLKRINVDPNQVIQLSVRSDTTKKKASIPEFINNPGSIRDIFTSCLDIRGNLKKAFLKLLANFCSDRDEKQRLLYLSSRQGSDLFKKLITEDKRNLLHILAACRTCNPTLEALLENLPRLLPRPYSIACGATSNKIKFAFNVIDLPKIGNLYDRKGLVTGRFEQLIHCGPEIYPQVNFYLRSHQKFRLPEDPMIPLILIGPGTGVAPYIGFLEKRLSLMQSNSKVGQCVLFFGNRHKDKDFLFKEELELHLKIGTLTKLFTCFSRDQSLPVAPKYVTDLLHQQADLITHLVLDMSAYIYVCGDAKHMAKDVLRAITEILKSGKGLTDDEVTTVIKNLRDEKRYREDVWT